MELLRDGEKSAGNLIDSLGIEQANASQHLTVLRAKQIVVSRKEGNQVFYRVRDPIIVEVLDVMRRYFESHVAESLAMLEQVRRQESVKIDTLETD